MAEWLGVPIATVYQWRTKGYGPKGVKIGRHVRYRLSDVESWLADRLKEDRTPESTDSEE